MRRVSVVALLGIVILLIVFLIWEGRHHTLEKNLISKEDVSTELLSSLLAEENIKDVIISSISSLPAQAEPLTTEDAQTLIENDIVTRKEAESLLELNNLLISKEEEK